MSGTLSVKQPHHDQQVADVKAVGGRVETCRSVRTEIRVLFPSRKLFSANFESTLGKTAPSQLRLKPILSLRDTMKEPRLRVF